MQDSLKQEVLAAAARHDVIRAVAELYQSFQYDIDERRPLCSASGRCCRFEEFGHRLYVTTLELAAFAAQLQNHATQWDGTGCPFQHDRLCSVHPIRPFGCRVFFCDSTSTDWQHDRYEHYHARLKELHQELFVAYHYVEWRQGLVECQLVSNPSPQPSCEGRRGQSLSLPQLPL